MYKNSNAIGIIKFDFFKTNLDETKLNECMEHIIKLFKQNMKFKANKIKGNNNTYEFLSKHGRNFTNTLEAISHTIRNEIQKYCGLKIKFIYNELFPRYFLKEKIITELKIGVDKIEIKKLNDGIEHEITIANIEKLGFDPYLIIYGEKPIEVLKKIFRM